jgi:hypothetical protein
MSETTNHNPSFIVATRIHLGKQSNPPPQTKLISTLSTFIQTATNIGASRAVVAIDPAEKIKGYDLVQAMEEALEIVIQNNEQNEQNEQKVKYCTCDFLKVSPWGNFVPALNALVSYACTTKTECIPNNTHDSDYVNTILFISAETTVTKESMMTLCQHMKLDDTLVVGAALPGHEYKDKSEHENNERKVDLNGRTCPWNTMALWNLKKLKLGFPLVADGIHKMEDGSNVAAGIEEFSTVLIHQQLFNESKMKAKLVKVPGVEWEQSFTDEERKKWHEAKMNSKLSRAEMHRQVLSDDDDVHKGSAIHI